MMMRQEAKMGLKMMEAMGQMGNVKKLRCSDDLILTEAGLDTDDDAEYNAGGKVVRNRISRWDLQNQFGLRHATNPFKQTCWCALIRHTTYLHVPTPMPTNHRTGVPVKSLPSMTRKFSIKKLSDESG